MYAQRLPVQIQVTSPHHNLKACYGLLFLNSMSAWHVMTQLTISKNEMRAAAPLHLFPSLLVRSINNHRCEQRASGIHAGYVCYLPENQIRIIHHSVSLTLASMLEALATRRT